MKIEERLRILVGKSSERVKESVESWMKKALVMLLAQFVFSEMCLVGEVHICAKISGRPICIKKRHEL